jgi:hypothetical protein
MLMLNKCDQAIIVFIAISCSKEQILWFCGWLTMVTRDQQESLDFCSRQLPIIFHFANLKKGMHTNELNNKTNVHNLLQNQRCWEGGVLVLMIAIWHVLLTFKWVV